MEKATPLCLLLLPGVLEELPFRTRGEDLLRAPGVVAVEPGRVGTRRTGDALAATQARRLGKRLPGTPRVAVILHPGQYPLARALLGRHRECEVWYGPPTGIEFEGARLLELADLAAQRATLRFDPAPPGAGEAAHQANAPLWSRLEELGIARR